MNKQSLTIAEIRSGYSEEKRAFDKDYPWLYFVVRPVSLYPTWLLLKLGVNANQVTLIGLIISITGCIFLAFGSYWAAIIGAALVNIGYLFDVIDGNVARYNNACTKYGEFMDRMVTAIVIPLMSITVGIGVFNHPDPYLNSLAQVFLGMDVGRNIYLILGAISAFLYIFGLLVTANLCAVFSPNSVDFYRPKARHKVSLWNIIYKVGRGAMSLTWPILLVAAVAKFLSIFLLLWIIVTACYSISVTTRAFYDGRRLE